MTRLLPFILLTLSILCSCHDDHSSPGNPDAPDYNPDAPATEARRTVLIYCAAQNSTPQVTTAVIGRPTRSNSLLASTL